MSKNVESGFWFVIVNPQKKNDDHLLEKKKKAKKKAKCKDDEEDDWDEEGIEWEEDGGVQEYRFSTEKKARDWANKIVKKRDHVTGIVVLKVVMEMSVSRSASVKEIKA